MSFQSIDWHNHHLNVRSIARLGSVEVVCAICVMSLDGHCLGVDGTRADIGCTWHWGASEETFAQEDPKQHVP